MDPPKGQGGRDMRGVGLHASSGIKYLIYQTGNVGKTARIVMKILKIFRLQGTGLKITDIVLTIKVRTLEYINTKVILIILDQMI